MKNLWEDSFGFTKEDNDWLEKYRRIRKQLGWSKTANLLGWAFHNFPPDDEYPQMLEAIKYFESRKDKNGKTLKGLVDEALPIVKEEEKKIKSTLDLLPVGEMLSKAQKLLGQERAHQSQVFCYLLFSPTEFIQGGANGGAITLEVPLQALGDQMRELKGIIHEYTHFILRVGRALLELFGKKGKEFYTQKIPSLWQDDLSGFFEEVIVYTLVDINLAKRDPQEMVDYYNDLKVKGADSYSFQTLPIWQATLLFKPIIDNFLEGKTGKLETREKLFQASETFVAKNLLE